MKHLKTKIRPGVQITEYLIGENLLANLHNLATLKNKNYSKFLLLSDTTVFKLYGNKVVDSLNKSGGKTVISLIPPGEKNKSLQAVLPVVKSYFEAGFDRNTCLVSLGGGVITDLGTFIGSLLLRGIDCVHLPTTLLGQIDAAIGGKGGVDFQLAENLMIKNMIGTIKQPVAVVCDVDTLFSLPQKEILNGLGEMTKYWVGWGKPSINQLKMIKTLKTPRGWQAERSETMTPPMVEEIVKTISLCQQVKIDIVQQDPFETKGIRQQLNLGHTIGHAVEGAANGKISHGQAVSIGLAAVARISLMKNICSEITYNKIINGLQSLGLPINLSVTMYRYMVTKEMLMKNIKFSLKLDKKGGTFVLVKNIGKLTTGVKVENEIISKVLSEVVV